MNTDKKRAIFRITGLVQGVGFRYFVYRHASAVGLKGYVANRYDGSVFAIVEGGRLRIEELHKHLRQGPSHSRVEQVKVEYGECTNEFSSFTVKETYGA